jgi:diaminohydroxyphosphoribosylaminopyrimidine deaminase/5-amino-6-(5-phosphoribosylamino)uracil reductase
MYRFTLLSLQPVNMDELYMYRCLQLAKLGAGHVAPNPMVGAVLVYQDRIIGEGYHQQCGGPHAEVNCIASVKGSDKGLVSESTMYVSLEPCAHTGKTPPCADMIIKMGIPAVVIGCRDPFTRVDGKGIEKLQQAGVETRLHILEDECMEMNKRFICFHTKFRPYIILKWAQTQDGVIGSGTNERLLISGELSSRLVHQWRSEEAAIMVGTNTAALDNPSLTTRFCQGTNPTRIVIDSENKLKQDLKIFDGRVKTIVYNNSRAEKSDSVEFVALNKNENSLSHILKDLFDKNIQSLLVEGGARLLQSFIDAGLWDEARIITNEEMIIGKGVAAPVLKGKIRVEKMNFDKDLVEIFRRNN